MRADAAHDVIVDFDPWADQLDLSFWPDLYSVDQLDFDALADGARPGHGDESLTLKTVAGQILERADLQSIDVQFHHILRLNWLKGLSVSPHSRIRR